MTYNQLHSILNSYGINCGIEKQMYLGRKGVDTKTTALYIEDSSAILNNLSERINFICGLNLVNVTTEIFPNEDKLLIKLK